jgi:hypothetical protein
MIYKTLHHYSILRFKYQIHQGAVKTYHHIYIPVNSHFEKE